MSDYIEPTVVLARVMEGVKAVQDRKGSVTVLHVGSLVLAALLDSANAGKFGWADGVNEDTLRLDGPQVVGMLSGGIKVIHEPLADHYYAWVK